ncbi:MAG: hypothetical protein AB1400_01430 [Pseudomonadota bacterium]
MKRIVGLVALGVSAAQWSLQIGDLNAPGLAAHGVVLHWLPGDAARLETAELMLAGRRWRNVRFDCGKLRLTSGSLHCAQGRFAAAPTAVFDLQADWGRGKMALVLEGADGERWRVTADREGANWQVEADLQAAQWARLAAWLPETLPKPTQGKLDGRIRLHGDAHGVLQGDANLRLAAGGFADAEGLHAAEHLAGTVALHAQRVGDRLQWRGTLDWQAGEMFWQPWYLQGGQRLEAAGTWDGKHLRIAQITADIAGVGRIAGEAEWQAGQPAVERVRLRGQRVALKRLFAEYARPLFGEGMLAASEVEGEADFDWDYRAGATQRLHVVLREAGLRDGLGRFALHGVHADIPWRSDGTEVAQVAFSGGALWGVELGAAQFALRMNGLEFTLPQANLPVLDGQLSLRDFHLHREQGRWHWQFAGGLTPVSMERLSRALGWTSMHGTLSGVIPQVRYDDGRLGMDGALLFRVFDGTAVVSRLALDDPFGPAPRLAANVDMRNLDLDLLTRTFSFGNMQGRVDVGVQGLELANWQPAAFNAHIASSPGTYPRKISQKAVQNISSLGGAGAAAALQRGYLRMFENFGYDRIGLSCALRNDVCLMDGVEPNGAGYVIVKGGGIPAISVMGYNRAVGWSELLARVKRVMQDNAHPVIR